MRPSFVVTDPPPVGGFPHFDKIAEENSAVAESFFQLLKRERIKRKTCKDLEEALLGYIRLHRNFLQSGRCHGYNDDLSPFEFERQYLTKTGSV